jgi:2'-5' RNA ligase
MTDQAFSSHYIIAMPVAPVVVNKKYSSLPLHCTVHPPFRLNKITEETLLRRVEHEAKYHTPVELVSYAPALFGPQHDIPVFRVIVTDEIKMLHHDVTRIMRFNDATYLSPEYMWKHYVPHVTSVDGEEFVIGSKCVAQSLYVVLVTNGPATTVNKVVAEFFFPSKWTR